MCFSIGRCQESPENTQSGQNNAIHAGVFLFCFAALVLLFSFLLTLVFLFWGFSSEPAARQRVPPNLQCDVSFHVMCDFLDPLGVRRTKPINTCTIDMCLDHALILNLVVRYNYVVSLRPQLELP